mgnify:CR=1 FL=1
MTRALSDRIEDIEGKINKLVRKFEIVKKENTLLLEENIQLKQQINNYKKEKKENKEAGQQAAVDNGFISKSDAVERDKIKNELNKYIKEVQECIDQLQTS